MSQHILDALDPEQQRVATLLDKPVVVLAGAGTGKTRAITHRIAYAVSQGRYAPEATLAVTFTTRAAGEMKTRLAQLGIRTAQARTIHAAALRQCQFFWPRAYGVEFPQILDSSYPLIARAAHQVLGSSETALVRDLETEISWAKSSNVPAASYAQLAQDRVVSGASPTQVVNIMALYEKQKLTQGVVDFHDILLCNAALLSQHEDVAELVKRTYRHFVVDEYQDVSALQHRLIQLWVAGRDDVCVVGDPNQAIHSFAGADPAYLLSFAQDYPQADLVRLKRNYRSSPEILQAANNVLRNPAAALQPTRETGPRPSFHSATDETSEATEVAQWLVQQHQTGVPWSQLAVLYRINAQAPSLEAALTQAGVPYSVRGAERFYDRFEVRHFIEEFTRQAGRSPQQLVMEATDTVLTAAGWKPEAPSGQGRQRERWESLAALRSTLTEESAERPGWSAAEAANWLTERASWQAAPQADAVTLATLHAAKGLEWDSVAIIGVREGLVPFALAQDDAQLAEERRLLYVGFTRAQRVLRVSWSGGRGSAKKSRFLTGMMTSTPSSPEAVRPARSTRSRTCRVCGNLLHSAAERKLSRHEDCEVSYDEELFEALRQWRKNIAEQNSVPAFVVFTDATLQAIAEAAPRDATELLRLPGIGQAKVTKYGQEVLAVIASHQPTHPGS